MQLQPPNYQQPNQPINRWQSQGNQFMKPPGQGGGWTTAPAPGSWGNPQPQQPQAAYRGLEGQVNGQTQQFVDQRQNLRNLIGQYSDPRYMFGQGGWMGAALGKMGGFERAPLPNDPYANQYAQHLMGGQKQSVMDLAKNLRQSNVRGMRVAGGADPYSQLVKDAYGQLASGYSDRYGQSMDYARGRVSDDNAQRQYLASLGMQGQQNATSALNNMLNLQYQYAMADEDRRRQEQQWNDYMAERGRRWKTEDINFNQAQMDRAQQQGQAARNRQIYNAWSGAGPNLTQQYNNYLLGPPNQMGSLGWSGLPSYMK